MDNELNHLISKYFKKSVIQYFTTVFFLLLLLMAKPVTIEIMSILRLNILSENRIL